MAENLEELKQSLPELDVELEVNLYPSNWKIRQCKGGPDPGGSGPFQ